MVTPVNPVPVQPVEPPQQKQPAQSPAQQPATPAQPPQQPPTAVPPPLAEDDDEDDLVVPAELPPARPFFDVWSGAVATFTAARQAVREAKTDLDEGMYELQQSKQHYDGWVENIAELQQGLADAEADSKIAAKHLRTVLTDYIGD